MTKPYSQFFSPNELGTGLLYRLSDMAVQTVSLALPITYMHFVVMVTPYPIYFSEAKYTKPRVHFEVCTPNLPKM